MPGSFLDADVYERLELLASRCSVATTYWDWHGNLRNVGAPTLIRVLRSLGLRISNNPTVADLDDALTEFEDNIWLRILPACSVVRAGGHGQVLVHVPDGESVHLSVTYEDGSHADLNQIENWDPPRQVGEQLRGRAAFALEDWLPLGYHTLHAKLGNGEEASAPLIVVPDRLNPPALTDGQRAWGVSSQLYSVRSRQCWGMGDTSVLTSLNRLFAKEGADFHLINPLHAADPSWPIEPSPYLPVTRQHFAPLYIDPTAIAEYGDLSRSDRLYVDEAHEHSLEEETDLAGLIDRNRSWEAKREALGVIFTHPRSAEREEAFQAFIERGGEHLRQFALWCALVEVHGMPLTGELSEATSGAVTEFALTHDERVRFHMWLQWIISEQLQDAQRQAREAGMSIGIMSDLAVGVHPYGADAWSTPELFASHMSVGAPPDMYSQQGQNWSQPPWNPRALAESGYRPLRAMLRAALSYAGAVRIDHILGLFRLWWIPRGMGANEGAYVHYDHEAMVGVLLLEAERAGATVIGEDLGTVEPWVRGFLNDRGILGTSIVWFERDHDGRPLPPEHYRSAVLAAVNTHDLPPTAGYLDGVQAQLREELGLLVEPAEQVRARDRDELAAYRQALAERKLLEGEDNDAFIAGLHRYIGATPARLLSLSLVDVVGDVRPQNLPGTHYEYPNWQIPLSDSKGREVTMEDLSRRGLGRLAAIMREVTG